MSTVIILAPVIVGAWPLITSAAMAAAASLGLTAAEEVAEMVRASGTVQEENEVEVTLSESSALAGRVHEDQKLEFATSEGVKITVKRDARGKCSVCASGLGFSDTELEMKAKEFSDKFSQCFVYNKIMKELKAKNLNIIEQNVEQDKSIRLHIRNWEQ